MMENSFGLYIGNLTWWTTDQDVINAINSVGINDIQEVKFFENRINGQSKGFCVVTFDSEVSLPIVMEKLPKLELYGQNPVVTQYNRQNLNLFESQTKTRPQISSNNGPNSHAAGIMGISSISGVHAGTQGLSAYGQAGAGGLGVAGAGGPRTLSWPVDGWSGNPHHHNSMMPRVQMRASRPMGMRGSIPGAMGNGPVMMNRMRFIQPQTAWNNSQGPYNPATRMPQVNMELSSRLGGMSGKPDDSSIGQDMMSSMGSQSYYTPHHPSSHSDHYRDDRSSRRGDESRSSRRDEGSSSSSRREEGSSSSRREEGSSSSRRGDEGSSRRDERSKREEKSLRREKSHRSDDRGRSRSRERSRDRSRERKERRERRDRY